MPPRPRANAAQVKTKTAASPTFLPGRQRAAANRCGARVPCLVLTAIVDDALPARFNCRKQSLRPYCGSDAASEADHKNSHFVPQSICLSRTSIASGAAPMVTHAVALDDGVDVARLLLNLHIKPFFVAASGLAIQRGVIFRRAGLRAASWANHRRAT